ncbi:hypothetical protein A7G45_14275 [Mycolicibacterium llatzerense]|nr:hypothetical protein [Mycolicibacterium llatzerense]
MVEQRFVQWTFRVLGEVLGCCVRIPVRTKEIRAEVFDDVLVVVSFENLQGAELGAHRLNVVGFQDDSRPMVRPSGSGVDLPLALHLEVRVDAGPGGADEQVLAAAEHFVDLLSAEVDGRELRDANVAARQRLSLQCLAEHCCGMPDGVAFGHQRM